MQEIDQRPKDRLIIPCNCGWGTHSALFDMCIWGDTKEFSIGMVDTPSTFWQRIKNGLKYIFTSGDLYYMEVSATQKDLDKLIILIEKYRNLTNK